MMYGVIDIGSNTIRLVIYRLIDGQIQPMLNKKYAAGLAGYVNKKNCLKEEGIERAAEIMAEIRQITENIGVDEVYPFATASLRNIDNGDAALNRIREQCGWEVRVLTGNEEAVFDYYGAIQSIQMESGLLVDVGGGSTELVFYREKEVIGTESLPIGSLNLYNRFVEGILPTEKERKLMEKEIRRQLEKVRLPEERLVFNPICGVGGTARATLKLYNHLTKTFRDNRQYEVEAVGKILKMLEEQSKKLIQRILQTAPERIHTLIPGMMILQAVAETYDSRQIITSSYGVREGYLYYLLEERGELNV